MVFVLMKFGRAMDMYILTFIRVCIIIWTFGWLGSCVKALNDSVAYILQVYNSVHDYENGKKLRRAQKVHQENLF